MNKYINIQSINKFCYLRENNLISNELPAVFLIDTVLLVEQDFEYIMKQILQLNLIWVSFLGDLSQKYEDIFDYYIEDESINNNRLLDIVTVSITIDHSNNPKDIAYDFLFYSNLGYKKYQCISFIDIRKQINNKIDNSIKDLIMNNQNFEIIILNE